MFLRRINVFPNVLYQNIIHTKINELCKISLVQPLNRTFTHKIHQSKHTNHQYHIQLNNNKDQQHNKSKTDYGFLLAAGLFSFFNSSDSDDAPPPKKYIIHLRRTYPFLEIEQKEEKPETPQEMLITTLKRAIVSMQFEEFEKAEQMLHLALRMAQDMRDFDGITYCFDIMANLALEVEQYEKSEKLFVTVMQRLLQKGCEQDDIKLLHISGKIAQIASKQGLNDKAEQGFAWTLDGLNKKRKIDPDDRDLYELVGLIKDWYGKHLMKINCYPEARQNLAEALNIYIDVHGKDDPEVVDLLNNLAAVCLEEDDIDAADRYINESLKLAENYPDLLKTGVYQANRGLISIKQGLIKEATKHCTAALQVATQYEFREGQEQAKYCLEQIKLFTRPNRDK